MAELLIPGGAYLNEGSSGETLVPGFGYLNQAGAAGTSSQVAATTGAASFSGQSTVSPSSRIAATTGAVTFSGASQSGAVTSQISASTGAAAFYGQSAVPAGSRITATTGSTVFSGQTVGDISSGTVTTEPFKNNVPTLLTGLNVDKVWVVPLLSTPDFSNVTTHATTGVLTLSGVALTPGVDYLIVSANTAGTAVGVRKYTAT